MAVALVIGAPVAEEVFFRGWLWAGLRQSWGVLGTSAATGAWFKFTLITRAAFNQGFALARLPVRGVPH